MREMALAVVKPDAVRRGLTTTVFAHIRDAGLSIVEVTYCNLSYEQASKLYEAHVGRSYFDAQIEFMMSGSVVVMKLEAEDCSTRLRAVVDDLRALYKTSIRENIIHGSDTPESGRREVELFFPDES